MNSKTTLLFSLIISIGFPYPSSFHRTFLFIFCCAELHDDICPDLFKDKIPPDWYNALLISFASSNGYFTTVLARSNNSGQMNRSAHHTPDLLAIIQLQTSLSFPQFHYIILQHRFSILRETALLVDSEQSSAAMKQWVALVVGKIINFHPQLF